jgi:hypothetical protein
MGSGEFVRRASPAGRAAVLLAVVAYWVGAGFVGWSLAWSDAPPPGLPSPIQLLWPNELQPLFDEPMGGGGGGAGNSMSYDVGDDAHVVVELLYVGQELPETVPPRRQEPLTMEQRHERDLAFAEGEDALARWEEEVGANRRYVELPRTPALIDLEVACLRLVVSAYGVPDPDPEGTESVEALLRQRVEELHAALGDVCDQVWWYEGE